MTDTQGTIRTRLHLDTLGDGAHASEVARYGMPLAWHRELVAPRDRRMLEKKEAEEVRERLLSEIFPEDGDETLLYLLVTTHAHAVALYDSRNTPRLPTLLDLKTWRDPIEPTELSSDPNEGVVDGVLTWNDIVKRVHEEAGKQGEIWNPVLDIVVEQPRSQGHDEIWPTAEAARDRLTGHKEEGKIPFLDRAMDREVFAPLGEKALQRIEGHPNLKRLRSLAHEVREKEGEGAGLHLGGFENVPFWDGRRMPLGFARAMTLAPHLEAIEDPNEIRSLLDNFRSAAIRTAVALFARALEPDMLDDLLQVPDARAALLANPSARALIASVSGTNALMNALVTPGIEEREPRDARIREADTVFSGDAARVKEAIASLLVATVNEREPYSGAARGELERALANTHRGPRGGRRESDLNKPSIGRAMLGDPGLGPERMRELISEGIYAHLIDFLRHPRTPPGFASDIGEKVVRRDPDQGSTDVGFDILDAREEMTIAARNSHTWRLDTEGSEPREARREVLASILPTQKQKATRKDDIALAIAQSPDCDAKLFAEIFSRRLIDEDDAIMLSTKPEIQNDPGKARTLLDAWPQNGTIHTMLLFTEHADIFQEVFDSYLALDRSSAIEALASDLTHPPKGVKIPREVLETMLGSPDETIRQAGIRVSEFVQDTSSPPAPNAGRVVPEDERAELKRRGRPLRR